MTTRFTIALRVCVNCQHQFGVAFWPWSGAAWTRTHGICRSCRVQAGPVSTDKAASQHSPTSPSSP